MTNIVRKERWDCLGIDVTITTEKPAPPTLEQEIGIIGDRIAEWADEAYPSSNDRFVAYKLQATAAIDRGGENAENQLADALPRSVENIPDENMRRHIALACMQLVRAERAMTSSEAEANDAALAESRLECARHHVAQAKKYLDMVEADYSRITRSRTNQRRASNGGKKRGEIFAPAKQECIRLLKESRPQGGWKSHAKAAGSIAYMLGKFIDDHPTLKMKSDAAYDRILDWLRDDADIKRAFEGPEG